jgi:16S rRNA (cytosine1402-N4)-methyltransferase
MKGRNHKPVLLKEVINGFDGKNLKIFFDGTLGAGGHAKEILTTHSEIVRYIGCDQDVNALNIAKETLKDFENCEFVNQNFCEIETILKDKKISCVDGILLDIGVSSMQLDNEDRGFTFKEDAVLDMRMNQSNEKTAADILNTYDLKELEILLKELAEVRKYKFLAKAIFEKRKEKPFKYVKDLLDVANPYLKVHSNKKLNKATVLFQALRIAVNDELNCLKLAINKSMNLLCVGGRLSIISFHSGEDRIVKHMFKEIISELRGSFRVVTKKPIIASREEVFSNRRSRSAKLRILERTK